MLIFLNNLINFILCLWVSITIMVETILFLLKMYINKNIEKNKCITTE